MPRPRVTGESDGRGAVWRDPQTATLQQTRETISSKKGWRQQSSALVQQPDGFQHRIANNGETFRAELVHGVLRCVPERVVVSVFEINHISGRNAAPDEWDVIVEVAGAVFKEIGLVAVFRSSALNEVQ